ncbi:hypothetical protein SBA2_990004 [Acidobacteriia bacterium SbA2]|nr:hypothetical protein SBA2_990004 [Acidobacteriia bacterium SbA2]
MLVIFPLPANKVDAFEMVETALRDAYARCIDTQAVSDGGKTVGRRLWRSGTGCILGCIFVPEL